MPNTNQGSYTQRDLVSILLSRAYDIILAWPDLEKAHQIRPELESGKKTKNYNHEIPAGDEPKKVES